MSRAAHVKEERMTSRQGLSSARAGLRGRNRFDSGARHLMVELGERMKDWLEAARAAELTRAAELIDADRGEA